MSQPTLFDTPKKTGHAPGWSWRRDVAGKIAMPWPGMDRPHLGGLCEQGWHQDCPQLSRQQIPCAGQCSCTCHDSAAAQLVVAPR